MKLVTRCSCQGLPRAVASTMAARSAVGVMSPMDRTIRTTADTAYDVVSRHATISGLATQEAIQVVLRCPTDALATAARINSATSSTVQAV